MNINYLILIIFVKTLNLSAQKGTVKISDIRVDSLLGDITWTITYLDQTSSVWQGVERHNGTAWLNFRSAGWVFSFAKASESSSLTEKEEPVKKQWVSHHDSLRVKFHKGLNRFRIKVTRPDTVVSPEICFRSRVSNDDGSVWIVNQEIQMEQKEYYEIIDHNGTTLLKGEQVKVNISGLRSGAYFLYTKTATRSFTRE